MIKIHVQMKQAGKRSNKIITKMLKLEKAPRSIKELLKMVTEIEYKEFLKKLDKTKDFEQELIQSDFILTESQIQDKVSTGKIGFGTLKSNVIVNEKQAVETSIQAFEDGLTAIFIDGIRYEDINEEINMTGQEVVTFVKLAMLAGRMW